MGRLRGINTYECHCMSENESWRKKNTHASVLLLDQD